MQVINYFDTQLRKEVFVDADGQKRSLRDFTQKPARKDHNMWKITTSKAGKHKPVQATAPVTLTKEDAFRHMIKFIAESQLLKSSPARGAFQKLHSTFSSVAV